MKKYMQEVYIPALSKRVLVLSSVGSIPTLSDTPCRAGDIYIEKMCLAIKA